jgi:hypothetical protein
VRAGLVLVGAATKLDAGSGTALQVRVGIATGRWLSVISSLTNRPMNAKWPGRPVITQNSERSTKSRDFSAVAIPRLSSTLALLRRLAPLGAEKRPSILGCLGVKNSRKRTRAWSQASVIKGACPRRKG